MFAWYRDAEPVLIATQLALIMLGMGATLRVRDFGGLARDPAGVGIALVMQWVALPAAAVGLALALDLSRGWAVGLLLIATAPAAAFSNVLTFLGRGNVALSVCACAVTAIASLVTIPVQLAWLASTHMPAGFAFPAGRIAVEIVAYLLAPLAVGMMIHHAWPARSRAISRWCIRGSLALVVVLTGGALGSGRMRVTEYGWQPGLTIILFGAGMAFVTPHVCRLLSRYDEDTLAITVQVAMRNMGVALLGVRFFFPGEPEQGHVLYSCLFYAGAGVWFAVPAVLAHRFGRSFVIGRARRPRPAVEAAAGAGR